VRQEERETAEDQGFDEPASSLQSPDGEEDGRERQQAGDHGGSRSEESPSQLSRERHEDERLRETDKLQGQGRCAPEREAQCGQVRLEPPHVPLAVEEDGKLALEHVSRHESDDRLVGIEDAVRRDDEEEAKGESDHAGDRQAAGETEPSRRGHETSRAIRP
jgi:hypothetical protein